MTTELFNSPSFPYRRRWTRAEVEVILQREGRIALALIDAVGAAGEQFYIHPDQLRIIALHLALAGGDVDDEKAYIVAEILPDEPGAFEGRRKWHLKSEYQPAPPDPVQAKVTAEAAAEKIRRQLPPEVMAELTEILKGTR